MNYSTLEFIETLKLERRSLWRTEFLEPYSGVSYGYIIKVWPITYLHIIGWQGEQLTAIKIGTREWTW